MIKNHLFLCPLQDVLLYRVLCHQSINTHLVNTTQLRLPGQLLQLPNPKLYLNPKVHPNKHLGNSSAEFLQAECHSCQPTNSINEKSSKMYQ